MRTRVKICGITRLQDALAAVEQGVDALGFVFVAKSPRHITIAQAAPILEALPPFVTRVGLFMDAPPEQLRATLAALPLDLVQFHGAEDPAVCDNMGLAYLKAIPLGGGIADPVAYAAQFHKAQAFLLDGHGAGEIGGQGRRFEWARLTQQFPKPIILAGGLDAANVAQAIAAVRPYAVDVSSGVEASKGIKDHAKIAAFMRAVRQFDTERS